MAPNKTVRAVRLQPDSPVAHEVYAWFLTSRGRHIEAINESKKAVDLEPSSLFYQRNFGLGLFYARRYDEAANQLKRVIEMDSSFESTFPWLYSALQMQGKHDEAFDWFIKYQSKTANEEQLQNLRSAYDELGWQAFFQQQAKLQNLKGRGFFNKACQNAQAGNIDHAFELLENAFARREWGIAYLDVDPRLDSVRDDPRFISLINRAGIRR